MVDDIGPAIELLEAIAAEPIESGPVQLSAEYPRAVEAFQNLPSNQDGADKRWVGRAERRRREFFARAVLVR